MKRLCLAALVSVLAVGAAGCGKSNRKSAYHPPATTAPTLAAGGNADQQDAVAKAQTVWLLSQGDPPGDNTLVYPPEVAQSSRPWFTSYVHTWLEQHLPPDARQFSSEQLVLVHRRLLYHLLFEPPDPGVMSRGALSSGGQTLVGFILGRGLARYSLGQVRGLYADLAQQVLEGTLSAPVEKVYGMGFLLGVKTTKKAAEVQAALLERGVIVGTSDDPSIFRLLPPLTLTAAQADEFIAIFRECIAQ